MARRQSMPALGGVGLIALCFAGSATLRLSESGWALAQEIGSIGTSRTEMISAGYGPRVDGDTLLAAIQEREAELDRDALRMAERAQTLNVAEAKLAEQLQAFEVAQRRLEETLALADKAAENDIARMTAVYESMKPSEAARIFERMDVSFSAGLMARMRPELAAEVLARMEADSAYAVTLTIASRNSGVPTD